MKRIYAFRVMRTEQAYSGNRRGWEVWIISRRIRPAQHGPSSYDVPVNMLWRGPHNAEDVRDSWTAYAADVARIWNACVLAAELLEAECEMPAEVMADYLDDRQEVTLATLLRHAYAPEAYGLGQSRLRDSYPRLPAGSPEHYDPIPW